MNKPDNIKQLTRVIYSSTMLPEYNNSEHVNKIIAESQISNNLKNIGGELHWNEEKASILQVLEGCSFLVNELFEKIKKDPRHKNITLLACVDLGCGDRKYGGWCANETTPSKSFRNKSSIQNYDLRSIIGAGGTSTVVLGEHIESNKLYAIKMISKRRMTAKRVEGIINERNILMCLNNPFLQRLKETLQDACHVYIVTPLAECGDLYNCVNAVSMTKEIALFYFAEILAGLKYLHKNKIIHGDMKLENILINKDGHIVLADFGISQFMNEGIGKLCGTPLYFAPETVLHRVKTYVSDIWGLGVMLFEMFEKRIPWQGLEKSAMFEKILISNLSDELSIIDDEQVKTIIEMCCVKDRETRPTSEIMCEHLVKNDIIQSWDDISGKRFTPPFIPQTIREIRTTIPEFEVNMPTLLEEEGEVMVDDNITKLLHDTFSPSQKDDEMNEVDERRL